MHGGTNPGAPAGNQSAVKHGIYRSVLSEEERADFDDAELGSVDDELRLARVRITRALRAEKNDPSKDFSPIIDRLLGRIESLEQTRRKLIGEDDEDSTELIDGDSDIEG